MTGLSGTGYDGDDLDNIVARLNGDLPDDFDPAGTGGTPAAAPEAECPACHVTFDVKTGEITGDAQ
jgi:hypothetical protein